MRRGLRLASYESTPRKTHKQEHEEATTHSCNADRASAAANERDVYLMERGKRHLERCKRREGDASAHMTVRLTGVMRQRHAVLCARAARPHVWGHMRGACVDVARASAI